MKCNHCGKNFEELEHWGNYDFCDECAKKFSEMWRKPPKRGANNIKLNIESGGDAQYNPNTGSIILVNPTEDLQSICVWFQHEAMHWVLHKMIGIRGTFQYDHFSGQSELERWTHTLS